MVPVPVLPVRPSDESALPVPMIDRSAVVPVEICSAPLELIDDLVWPDAAATVAPPVAIVAVWTPVARSIAFSVSATVRALQVDRRVAVTVGDEVTADTGDRSGRSRPGSRRVLERDGLAVDVQGRAILDQVPSERRGDACAAVTVTSPAPTDAVGSSASRRSALPVMLRSAPVRCEGQDAGRDGGRWWPERGGERRLHRWR